MTKWTGVIPWVGVLLLAGCGGSPKAIFSTTGIGASSPDTGEADADTDADTDADADADADTDTGPFDTGEEGNEVFDNPGDTITFAPADDGSIKIDLTDISGEDNREQDFFLTVVNTDDTVLGFTLRYIPTVEDEGGGGGPTEDPDTGAPPLAVALPALETLRVKPMLMPAAGPRVATVPLPPPSTETLDETDIGIAERVFHIRRDLEDTDSCEVVVAKLWAVGDSVAIWVDGDLPIDRYLDCDDLEGGGYEPAEYEAHGFDNCDLAIVANIVDTNIVPNAVGLLGDPSDVNYDGLVSVVISPVLNSIALTSTDEDDWPNLIESYTDPATDLDVYEESENPCSDYQEVIYVFAPDPYGAYNAFSTVTVDEYTGMELAGQIALGMAKLITYNQKVIVNEGDAEESWIVSGLGAVVADLTGFGAIFFDDAWDYMDAPHLKELVLTADPEKSGGEYDDTITTRKAGAQYLFFRWLVDAFGEEILGAMVTSETLGMDTVEIATGEEMADLVIAWQVALKTSGVLNADGDIMMDTDAWIPYDAAVLVSAPWVSPAPGDYYGANGYQMGINVGGLNLYMGGGTTEVATQIEENHVVLSHTDHFTYVAGVPFYGFLEANFGAQVIRLTDIPYASATIEIQSSSSSIRGAVTRWVDADTEDYKVEDVFSATDANNMELPPLPEDGSIITGLGTISEPGITVVINPGAESMATDVYDTDRWLLDLTDREASDDIDVAITVDRRYENLDGDIAPYDVWVAVVPSNLLPTPTVGGTSSGSCEDGETFSYPASLLDYLYYQMYLSSDSGADGVTGDFDPCGGAYMGDTADTAISGELSCAIDWDGDGVLNNDEPMPVSLVEQVMVMQCTLAGGVMEDFEPVVAGDIVDQDSVDEDDDPYVDRARNLGGRSGDEAEEAYLEVSLAGGASYVIVVGAGTDTGPYELRVQQLD